MSEFKFKIFYNCLTLGGLIFILVGLFYTPYPAEDQQFRDLALSGPTSAHWLGVDGLGRDFGSRLWKGAAHSVGLSLAASVVTLFVASILVTGEQVKIPIVSQIIRITTGLWVAVPVIFMGLILLVFLRPSPFSLIIAVSLGLIPFLFRQLRILWLEQSTALYVRASEVLGASRWQRFMFTIIPNLMPDLRALFRLLFALSMLELSGLAFLGLMGDPDFPELGSILKQNQAYIYQAPFMLILPGAILSVLLLWVHLMDSQSD